MTTELSDTALRDSFCSGAGDYHSSRPRYPLEIADFILPEGRCDAVLEVGTGTGLGSRLFVGRCNRMVCIDPSEDMLTVAKREIREPHVEFIAGNFEETGSKFAQTFDLVFSAQAFHWVDSGARQSLARQCLNRGGRLGLFWAHVDFESSNEVLRLRETILRFVPAFSQWPDCSASAFEAHRNLWRSELSCWKNVRETVLPVSLGDMSWLLTWILTLSWYKSLATDQRELLHRALVALVAEAPSAPVVGRTLVFACDDR